MALKLTGQSVAKQFTPNAQAAKTASAKTKTLGKTMTGTGSKTIKAKSPTVKAKLLPKKSYSRVTKKPLPKGYHSDAYNEAHGFYP